MKKILHVSSISVLLWFAQGLLARIGRMSVERLDRMKKYFEGGLATTVFWIDPEEELIVIMMSRYLPYAGEQYRDVVHRLVRAAIIE